MKLDEAKLLVKSLLEKVNISVVYYIDDYLSFDGLNTIMSYIEDTKEENLRSNSALIPEEFAEIRHVDPDIRAKIQEWWLLQPNPKRIEIIGTCVPQKNAKAENYVQQLLGEICVLCSPEEWENKYSTKCISRIKSGEKALLLFDYKLGDKETAEGEGRNGLNLAQKFSVNEGVKDNSYCGIFSQQIEIEGENGEFQFRKNNKEKLASWAFPFSKYRIPDGDDYTKFIEGLNNLLWVGYVDKLSEMAKSLIKSTAEKIESAFDDILPLEFKQLIINSSDAEGCREIDTLLRLIHIVFDRELQNSLTEAANGMASINMKVEAIKDIDSVVKNKMSAQYDTEFVKGFFQDENFIKGDIINKLLMPLQNGDVFCVEEGKYYVLLCQPCNIALRRGGKRGGHDIGYFVPLAENNPEESLSNKLEYLKNKKNGEWVNAKATFMGHLHKKMNEAVQGYLYRLKCSIDGKSLNLVLNDYSTISLALLDYCTFSEDGQVIINKDCSTNLHLNQKQLHKKHVDTFKTYLDFDHLLEGLSEETHVVIKPKVESWFYSLMTKLGIKPRFENSKYIFPIKRYGHIQDPLASDLLTQLSHYMSRAGLPNEFETKK